MLSGSIDDLCPSQDCELSGAALREAAGQLCLALGSGLHADLSMCPHIPLGLAAPSMCSQGRSLQHKRPNRASTFKTSEHLFSVSLAKIKPDGQANINGVRK